MKEQGKNRQLSDTTMWLICIGFLVLAVWLGRLSGQESMKSEIRLLNGQIETMRFDSIVQDTRLKQCQADALKDQERLRVLSTGNADSIDNAMYYERKSRLEVERKRPSHVR